METENTRIQIVIFLRDFHFNRLSGSTRSLIFIPASFSSSPLSKLRSTFPQHIVRTVGSPTQTPRGGTPDVCVCVCVCVDVDVDVDVDVCEDEGQWREKEREREREHVCRF